MSGVSYRDIYSSIGDDGESKRRVAKRNVPYLSITAMQKIILRFLIEKKMTKKELATVLGITVRSLDQLFSSKVSSSLISKINLPLVNLYCSTKWK